MKRTLLTTALFLTCSLVSLAQTIDIWAPGVSFEKGWKDVDKLLTDEAGDSSLCWAAAASNVMSWWQEQNASHLANYKEGIPQGEQAIFDAFNNAFYNKGFDGYAGLRWFMDGASEIMDQEVGEGVTVGDVYLDPDGTEQGGYYNGIVADIVSTMGAGSQLITDDYGFLVLDVVSLADFTKQLVDAVTSGGVTLGITGGEGTAKVYGHAITLWGVTLNTETNLIKSMWVTDSDDKVTYGEDLELFELVCTPTTKSKYVGEEGYKEYQVYAIEDTLFDREKRWYAGKDGYNEYVDSFGFLKANVQWSVPEPATGSLSLLALAGLPARRRRK